MRRLPEPVDSRAGLIGIFWHDLHQAWRSVTHQPALATTVIVVLATALACNAAVFAIADAMVLRPFRFPGIDRAVVLASDGPKRFFDRSSVAAGDLLEWKDVARDVFSRLAGAEWWDPNFTHDGPPQQIAGFRVSAALFDILGVRAELGRTLTTADEQSETPVAVLSHAFWTRQFGARADVIDKTVWLDGKPHRVVGVMPAIFTVPFGADVWAPLSFTPEARAQRTTGQLMVVGQLAPGISVAQADARMQVILAQEKKAFPDTHSKREVSVRSFVAGFGDAGAGPFVAVWQTAAFLLLLVACANVANLLLARNAERERELAVRLALGASGRRIAWQLILEALILAAISAVLALPLIWAALQSLKAALPDSVLRFVPGAAYLSLQPTTFAAAAALAVIATLLAALVPAWRASQGSVSDALRPGLRVSDGPRRQRGRAVLATAQIALTLALLATAGLSVSALYRVTKGPLGFATTGILTGKVSLPEARYQTPEKRLQFIDAVLRELRQLPSVTDAAATTALPYTGSYSTTHFWPEDVQPREATATDVIQRQGTPTALRLLQVPLMSGRHFVDSDTADAPRVALVSRALGDKFWPRTNVLGKRFRVAADGPLITIVGVVGDVMQDWIGDTREVVLYQPMAQAAPTSFSVLLRTVPDPDELTGSLRAAVQAADPEQPVVDVRSMAKVVEDKTVGLRFAANMLGVIAVVSCLLSSVGLYSLMSFLTTRRTREIGVRVALGATRWDVIRLTGSTAAYLTVSGVVLGMVLAYLAGRLLEQALFGVVTGNLMLAGGLAAILATISMAASYFPARRAAGIEPTVALRTE